MPGSAALRDSEVLEGMVRKHVKDGGFISAICAAPAVALGSWGLLRGLKVRMVFGNSVLCSCFNELFVPHEIRQHVIRHLWKNCPLML